MFRLAIVVFATAGLIGPGIRFATWPASSFREQTSDGAAYFISDLVFYLWPTQILGLLEPSNGSVGIVLLTVGSNVVLFAVLGIVVGTVARWQNAVLLIYGAVCGLLLFLNLWDIDFRFERLNVPPLLIAMAIYSIPFWLVAARGRMQAQ